jgi:hypothetical protein
MASINGGMALAAEELDLFLLPAIRDIDVDVDVDAPCQH